MINNGCGLFVFPVRRRLAAAVAAYLVGIYSAAVCVPDELIVLSISAVFLAAGAMRLRAGKPALFCVCIAALLAGNGMAGAALSVRDLPTQPYTPISGTVAAVEGERRVMLRDVCLGDGTQLRRPAVVTLMIEDDDPAPAAAPGVGQRISGTGRLFAQDEIRNPGGKDSRVYAIARGYELSGYILPGWTAQGEARFSLREGFRLLRVRLLDRLGCLFGEHAALFAAVMLGEQDEVDAELSAAMRLTGTAHVLSVSGMHLSMVSAALYALLRRLPIRRRTSQMIRIAALVFFTGLTGCAVGTVRALIMAMMQIYAKARGCRYDRLTALAAAALLITAPNPLMAYDGGFRFSFFVVLGIILLDRAIASIPAFRLLGRRMPRVCDMLTVSLSAQISAMPMQLLLYGYVPLLALPMNLLCMLLIPLIMTGGWAVLLIGLVHRQIGKVFADVLGAAAGVFESMSLFAASLEGSVLRLPSPHPFVLVLIAFAMALTGVQIRFGRKRKLAMAAVLLLTALLYLPRFDPSARYVQLDVGQGDASLIRTGRRAVVVDVGPAYSYDLLRYLRHEGLAVDAVILSHLDEDHAGALGVLLSSEIKVDRVIIDDRAQEYAASAMVTEAMDALMQAEKVETVGVGEQLDFGNVCLSVLSPGDALSGSNERSLLLACEAAGKTLLLAGDLPIGSEPERVPDCDVLKVAHHGSKNATSSGFLEMAQPEIALISAGAGNSYGHPHARVLKDLEQAGARILRTDRSGCITLGLQGETIAVQTMLGDTSGQAGKEAAVRE